MIHRIMLLFPPYKKLYLDWVEQNKIIDELTANRNKYKDKSNKKDKKYN